MLFWKNDFLSWMIFILDFNGVINEYFVLFLLNLSGLA